MENFKKHALRFGTEINYSTVTKVDFSSSPKTLIIDDNEEVYAETVIIATGASAKWLGLESEKRLNRDGVSACAICDGFFYKGIDVAIVGAGDTAWLH